MVQGPAKAHLKSPLMPSCCQMLTSVVPTEPRIRPVCAREEASISRLAGVQAVQHQERMLQPGPA